MKKQINPCKGCIQKYGIEDINSLNDCCYNTCSSFVGQNGLGSSVANILNTDCGKACSNCILMSIRAKNRNPREFWPNPPVVRDRPHFFMDYYRHFQNRDKAYKMCLHSCCSQQNPGECKQHCFFDSTAIL